MMTRQHIKPAIIPLHLLIKDKNNRRRRFYDVTARVFMLEVPYNPINTITADNLLYIKYPYFTSTILKIS